jgi:Tfp pilus assembly PilM family ATPase
MSRFRKQPRSPIGLDIGARRVKAVQLEPTAPAAGVGGGAPAGWRVATATCVNRTAPGKPLDAGEAARLVDTLDRLGFVGSRVVLAAPSDKLITGMLELPRAGGGQIPLEQIARVELARNNKVAPESFEMGCWELPVPARAGKAVHVMAVGFPHADATQLLDLVERAGLDVVGVDARSCALARACAAAVTRPPGITALLDLGWNAASLVLVYTGTIVYARPLTEVAISRVYDGLAKRLRLEADLADYLMSEVGLTDLHGGAQAAASAAIPSATAVADPDPGERLALPAEARSVLAHYADGVVRELLVSFSYVARQYTDASVTRLLLMGAGATVPGLREHLAKELGLETSVVAPRDLTECPTALLDACSAPELTPALGLAQFPET